MTRPIKNNADYFSHDNDMRDDEKIKAVRRKFGHIGYSIWNMLLESLCAAEYFRIEYSEDSLEILAGDFQIEPTDLKIILEYLIQIKLLKKIEDRIFNLSQVNRLLGVFEKRNRPYVWFLSQNGQQTRVSVTETPQSKVKERKGKESKEKRGSANPPDFKIFEIQEKQTEENSEEEKNKTLENTTSENNTPKSCAKKVEPITLEIKKNISDRDLHENLKQQFLTHAPYYQWAESDTTFLNFLTKKLNLLDSPLYASKTVLEKFNYFLQTLPTYWKTKKMTLYHLQYHFNEIIHEAATLLENNQIQNKKRENDLAKVVYVSPKKIVLSGAKKSALSLDEQKQSIKNSILETYGNFLSTRSFGLIPLFVMYETLQTENLLTKDKKILAKLLKQSEIERIDVLFNAQKGIKKLSKMEITEQLKAKSLETNIKNEADKKHCENEKYILQKTFQSLVVKAFFESQKQNNVTVENIFSSQINQ
jgi:Domain of unknown function (DUF4373)